MNYKSYKSNTELIQKTTMKVNILPAAISYFLLAVGITLCIVQDKPVWWHNTLYAGCLGLIIYGVYNATNAAIFTDYSTYIAIKDTIWGTFLMAIVVTAGHFIKKQLR